MKRFIRCLHKTRILLDKVVVSQESEIVQHAVLSTFDLFSIGIGPSSSHTVGPMRAARIFVEDLRQHNVLSKVGQMRVDLYGSLALTGLGHGTHTAILMGLEGESPEEVDAQAIPKRCEWIEKNRKLNLRKEREIKFVPEKHLIFHYRETLPQHPNGLRISAFTLQGDLIATNEFFSIGGGFVVNEQTRVHHLDAYNVFYKDSRIDHASRVDVQEYDLSNVTLDARMKKDKKKSTPVKEDSRIITAALPFVNAESLLRVCERKNFSIAQVVYKNELQWRNSDEIKARLLNIWNVMNSSIENGIMSTDEYLPGQLKVKRRAPLLYSKLTKDFSDYAGFGHAPSILRSSPSSSEKLIKQSDTKDMITHLSQKRMPRQFKRSIPALDWISLYAISVNEENAAGGRIVTAPTNGAAGVIPAVIKYYLDFVCPSPLHHENDIVEMLLTAAAIGMLYKRGASISAAEMGCQGEVGVACSMAAAAFTAVMGGTVEQVENAAEIAMEHNLGLTCDPISGLVQIPCIERNALGAIKAISASQLALNGDGNHRVSLDQVIETMRQTGVDMQSKYKETSQGGLAVNVPVC